MSKAISYRTGRDFRVWLCPFLADDAERQIERFHECLIARKRTAILGDFPQAHVQRLNRIGRGDDFQYFGWVVIVRRDARSGPAPGLAKGLEGIVLLVLEFTKHLLSLIGRGTGIYLPHIKSNGFVHFPRDIVQAVPDNQI